MFHTNKFFSVDKPTNIDIVRQYKWTTWNLAFVISYLCWTIRPDYAIVICRLVLVSYSLAALEWELLFSFSSCQYSSLLYILLMEAAGIEPASATILNSSHSQVCLVYCHKLEKIVGQPCAFRPDAPHQN